MKREQILLLSVFALLAMMSWSLLTQPDPRGVRPGVRGLELPELSGTDLVVELAEGGGRDAFVEPRETKPLAPLPLVLPPLHELEVLMPPPVPDCGPDYWSRFLLVHPPTLLGGINELVGEAAPILESTDADLGEREASEAELSAQWDSVRLDALSMRWGRIINDNRYDLVAGRDTLIFQEVEATSGTERFAPYELTPDKYESFQFADTLRNRIELGMRELPTTAGAIPERITFVNWLLDQGNFESIAWERAEAIAIETAGLAMDDIKVWLSLGDVWERTFRFDLAFTLYARMAGLAGADLSPLVGNAAESAVSKLGSGRFENSAIPSVRLGQLLERLGLIGEAEANYREAVSLSGGDVNAKRALGALLVEHGRAAEAVNVLGGLDSRYADQSTVEALNHRIALATAHLRSGDFKNAADQYARQQRAAGSDSDLALDGVCGETAAKYLSGDFVQALAMASAGVERFGGEWRLLYLRGIAAAASGQPAGEVMRDLNAAISAGSLDAAPALAAKAFWLDQMNEPEQARNSLEQALKLRPRFAYALYLRARWAREAGDMESARDDLHQLLSVAPRSAAVLGELGWLLNQEGRPEIAEVALRRAVAEKSDWAGIHLRRGLNSMQMRQIELARVSLGEAALGEEAYARQNALAWAEYLDGNTAAAIGEFAMLQDNLRGELENQQYQFAELWQMRIQEHSRLVSWFDTFEGKLARPEWNTRADARLGVEPRVFNGQLSIEGYHSGAGETRAFRPIRALDFRSAEGELTIGNTNRGLAGVSISLETRRRKTWEFRVEQSRSGLRWIEKAGAKEKHGETGIILNSGQTAKVAFKLDTEQTPPILEVRVNGEVIYSELAPRLRTPTGDLMFGAFVRTVNALPIAVSLDNVELVYATN